MKRRIRIGIPDGILNDYLKGMTNERAAYEIIRLATNNLHGFSDAQALQNTESVPSKQSVANDINTSLTKNEIPKPSSTKDKDEVSFNEDLKMLM